MGRPKNSQPSYLHHKPSGQARIRIDGIDHYLGPYESKESWNNDYQLLTERTSATATIANASRAANG